MGMIWTSKTRTRQPQGVARASSSLASGLVLLETPFTSVPTVSTAPKSGSTAGFGYVFDGTTTPYVGYNPVALRGYTGPTTVASILVPSTAATGSFRRWISKVESYGLDDSFGIQVTNTNKIQVWARDSGGGNYYLTSANTEVIANQELRAIGTITPGGGFKLLTPRGYVTGNSGGSNPGSIRSSTAKTYINRMGGYAELAGVVPLVCVWARELSEAEMRQWITNPWQLFAPQRTPVFYSLPSSSPTVGTIWTSKTRTRQPTRFARADTGRLPITHLWSGSAGVDTFIPDAAGTAHGTKGTLVAGQGYYIKPAGDSVVIEFDTSVGGANSQIINLGDASGSGGPRRLTAFTLFMEFMVPSISQAVFYSSGPGGLQFSLESGGILNLVKANIAVIGVASTAVATTNVWHKAAVSYDGTNYQFVLNGVAAGSGSNAVTISPVQQYFGGLVVGPDSYGAPPNGSKLKTFAVIDKVCSVEEMRQLCVNPWQLFAPERIPAFISLASSGTSTTKILIPYRRVWTRQPR